MNADRDETILELVDLKKVYDQDLFKPKQTVINNLSCRFPLGKCTGFMGHNGAGKTTTIRTIFGLIRPDQGKVLFKGHEVRREDKAKIGYMPELNKLPATLSCLEILKHHLRVFRPASLASGSYQEAIAAKLNEVGLWEHRHKKVGRLSKGMGRRLAWAQATIHEPELVILDEPFSGLDPLGRDQMLGWIKTLKRQRTSIILCTHELWTVPELCDEVHILRQGNLVFSTLAAGTDQPAPQLGKKLYTLQVSGCDETSLKAMRSELDLPNWISLDQEKYLAKLKLTSYPEAAAWMRACLAKGLVIIRFQDTAMLDPSELVQYFQGGSI